MPYLWFCFGMVRSHVFISKVGAFAILHLFYVKNGNAVSWARVVC